MKKKQLIDLLIKYRGPVLYLFFGGCTTVVNISIFYVCAHICGLSTLWSTVLAWTAGVVFAYVTNRLWVFESRTTGWKAIFREWNSFVACRLATGALDLAVMYISVDLLGANDMYMKILSNVIVIILNYIGSRKIVFVK